MHRIPHMAGTAIMRDASRIINVSLRETDMKLKDDTRTMELSLDDGRRGRGRPAKPDALTPAERARRYREKHKAMRDAAKAERHDGSCGTDKELPGLQDRMLKLQMKYDLEHITVINLQTELATLRQSTKRPVVNPLASQVAVLKKRVAEQERTITAYSAEINRLRDALSASRKK